MFDKNLNKLSMANRRSFLKYSLGIPFLNTNTLNNLFNDGSVTKPIVVSTWDSGIQANNEAWKVLSKNGYALDAVEKAANALENTINCCVGLGGNPDRDGFVTLDASIMDEKLNCGAVTFLEKIKNPISVAKHLMEHTPHVMLSGAGAQQYALQNGFALEDGKLSEDARKTYQNWLKKSKYEPQINIEQQQGSRGNKGGPFAPPFFEDGSPNHDTMGTIALDANGRLAGACTTSGMAFKLRGRVGDSPVIGAGLYVDGEVGAATSSGVGEEVIRICGTHLIVELMRQGKSPYKACKEAVMRIVNRDKAKAEKLQVGFIAINKKGEVGAYAIQKGFAYSITKSDDGGKVYPSESFFK